MPALDTQACLEVDGIKYYGRLGDRWLKDMDREELHALALRLAYALEGEKQAHEETLQLAAARCCAG